MPYRFPCKVKGMLFPISKNGINGQLYSRVVANILQFPKVYSDLYLCSWDENPAIQSPLKLLCCFWTPLGDTAFICSCQKEEAFLFHPCSFLYDALDFLDYYWLQCCLPSSNHGKKSICSCILYLLIFILFWEYKQVSASKYLHLLKEKFWVTAVGKSENRTVSPGLQFSGALSTSTQHFRDEQL